MGELLMSVHASHADMHKALEGRPVEGDKADPKLDALQVVIPPNRWPQKCILSWSSRSRIRFMHQALCRKPLGSGLVGVIAPRETTCLSAPPFLSLTCLCPHLQIQTCSELAQKVFRIEPFASQATCTSFLVSKFGKATEALRCDIIPYAEFNLMVALVRLRCRTSVHA